MKKVLCATAVAALVAGPALAESGEKTILCGLTNSFRSADASASGARNPVEAVGAGIAGFVAGAANMVIDPVEKILTGEEMTCASLEVDVTSDRR